mmetsp:Transcript_37001/g.64245  ORF Transcript_37001/g.64245 Transcript_37001/m.64245 type:complete len:320 (-) Transcript_37001:370-1329(-)
MMMGRQNSSKGSYQNKDTHEEDISFSCKMESIKELVTVLQCLQLNSGGKGQICQCQVDEAGFTFISVGRSKFTMAQAIIKGILFEAYQIDEENISFGINLSTFVECLQINGTSTLATTSVGMSFLPETSIFKMTLEDQEGIFTSCEINTVDDDGHLEFEAFAEEYQQYAEVCSVILKSVHFRDVISEMNDIPGAADVLVYLNAECFRLLVSGPLNSSEFELPSKSSELFVHFECKEEEVQWSYSIIALTDAMKALHSADETYIRINEQGVMCIQHQIKLTTENIFIDYLICANEIDDAAYDANATQSDGGGDQDTDSHT